MLFFINENFRELENLKKKKWEFARNGIILNLIKKVLIFFPVYLYIYVCVIHICGWPL